MQETEDEEGGREETRAGVGGAGARAEGPMTADPTLHHKLPTACFP